MTDTTHVAEMLRRPEHAEHHRCGIERRPCKTCRTLAPEECIDPSSCGIVDLCRPCASTWRCRLWRKNHLRHHRAFHRACERFPALSLHPDQETAAALYTCVIAEASRVMRRMLRRELTALLKYLRAEGVAP